MWLPRGLLCTLHKNNGRLTDARPQDTPGRPSRRPPIAAPTTAPMVFWRLICYQLTVSETSASFLCCVLRCVCANLRPSNHLLYYLAKSIWKTLKISPSGANLCGDLLPRSWAPNMWGSAYRCQDTTKDIPRKRKVVVAFRWATRRSLPRTKWNK